MTKSIDFVNNEEARLDKRWGRNSTPDTLTCILVAIMFFSVPFLAFAFQVTNLEPLNGSFQKLGMMIAEVLNEHNLEFINYETIRIVFLWITMQFILYLLPDYLHLICGRYKGGIQYGQVTPAGHKLAYNINGLQSLIITSILFGMVCYVEIISITWIAKNWIQLFLTMNCYGILLTIVMYVKALYFPSYPNDNKYSGSKLYDVIMGVELNPRIGRSLVDIKLFFNGRPGIIGWILINASFSGLQYAKYGTIYNSMILVNLLQGLYVADFFWNESWYLRTIDIAHDHFGWILTWGDLVWLPFMYTLQVSYLVNNPIQLNSLTFMFILIFGLFGYAIFRVTNCQKDKFRQGNYPNATYIECDYETSDGVIHTSKLLTSGCWGIARHLNYTGDLILSLAFCLPCGFSNVLPYFYFIYMVLLLTIRCSRDDQKCREKYGIYWETYCKRVKYQLIPYVY